jgi:hypothetical protein
MEEGKEMHCPLPGKAEREIVDNVDGKSNKTETSDVQRQKHLSGILSMEEGK